MQTSLQYSLFGFSEVYTHDYFLAISLICIEWKSFLGSIY